MINQYCDEKTDFNEKISNQYSDEKENHPVVPARSQSELLNKLKEEKNKLTQIQQFVEKINIDTEYAQQELAKQDKENPNISPEKQYYSEVRDYITNSCSQRSDIKHLTPYKDILNSNV